MPISKAELLGVVNRYIGVSEGHLGDFTNRSLKEFYGEYCGLDIDPEVYGGTKRARFITVMEGATDRDQARILRGVLERFPVGVPSAPATRTEPLRQEIAGIAARLQGGATVSSPDLRSSSAVVDRAIADADTLLGTTGATSGVDRIHTALHGYLIAICESAGLVAPSPTGDAGPSLTQLYRILREQHPGFAPSGPRADDIGKVLRAFSAALDALQPVRNQASVAHPNRVLLEQPEAMLVINAARTLLHYIDAKLAEHAAADGSPTADGR